MKTKPKKDKVIRIRAKYKKAWAIIYCGEIIWPLFKTFKEANKNKKYSIEKIKQIEIHIKNQ